MDYQSIILQINEKIKSKAFKPNEIIKTRLGNSNQVMQLVNKMINGDVGALIMAGVNPVYTMPNSEEFVEGLKKRPPTNFIEKLYNLSGVHMLGNNSFNLAVEPLVETLEDALDTIKRS